jgi:uncharacterized membrane protein (DUF2068 family)
MLSFRSTAMNATTRIDRSAPAHRAVQAPLSLRALALFEAAKGASALLLVLVSFVWVGRESPADLIGPVFAWLHFDPAAHLTQRVMNALKMLSAPTPLPVLAVALVYAVARSIEAWGLWRSLPWARWLAVASSAAFVPIEWEAIVKHPSRWTVLILVVNLAVIAWLLGGLRRSRRLRIAAGVR